MKTLFLLIAAAALYGAESPTGDAAQGRKLFLNYGCFVCHGTEAQGGGAGPRLAPKPIPFAALSAYVRAPKGQMPPYTAKVVSDKDLADVYAFLQSVKVPPPVDNIPILKFQ
jgi:ubiquinol-cytochrome c reductase cytochrome c subunit